MDSFIKRLSALQSELKAPKGQYNSFGKYKYRSCEDILEALKPLLLKYGMALVISDSAEIVGDRTYIKATARLTDTESADTIENTAFAREPEAKKGMDESQITGTASSYARKYALNGLFCIDDTKDADTDEYTAQQKQDKPPEYQCANCGKYIKAYNGRDGKTVTAAHHSKASMDKFGRILCLDCIKAQTEPG